MVLLDAPSIFMNSSVGKYRKYMRKILPENTTLKLDLLSPWLICQLFCIWGETRKCAKTGYGIFVKKWVWKCLESATWHLPAGLACNHYLPAWRRDRCWRPAGTSVLLQPLRNRDPMLAQAVILVEKVCWRVVFLQGRCTLAVTRESW